MAARVVGWGWFKPPAEPRLVRRPRSRTRPTNGRSCRRSSAGPSSGSPTRPPGADRRRRRLEAGRADGWPEADILDGPRLRPDRHAAHAVLPAARPRAPGAGPARRATRVRTVAGPDEIPARVEVHRAAFAPSEDDRREVRDPRRAGALRVRARRRRRWRRTVRSRRSRCAGWTARRRIGEFEPVGTHPDHQRRGLGKAVNSFGLRRPARAGARDAMVFSEAVQRRVRGALPIRRLPTDRDPPGYTRATDAGR